MHDNNSKSTNLHLLKLVLLHKKRILIFCLLAFLGSIVFTMPQFIAPQYRSEVIFYPPNTSSNKTLIQYDVRFGSDKEIDQHIQLLKSSLVRDSVIKKFKLIEHYSIDTSQKIWAYRLNKEYDEKINIDRTRYNALSVSVLDTDSKLAAKMANDIVVIADELKASILRKNLQAALRNLEMDYNKKVKEFDAFADNINRIIKDKNVGGLNLKNQSFVDRMKKQIDVIRELTTNDANDYDLKKQYNYESMLAQLAELQSSYEQASSNLNNNFPTCYVISPAHVSNKKESPNRTLLVLLTVGLAFLFSILWIVGQEKVNQLKHELAK
jgi:uncharacterized protein involved in exopolysaccharide biosynthesis